MALSDAVQFSRHTSQQITWLLANNPLDLTGAVLSATLEDRVGTVRAVDGDLAIDSAEAGQFTWTYGPIDVSVPGVYRVQFKAVFGAGDEERSWEQSWRVREAKEVVEE